MDELTVILKKNPTTGYWKAYVLQEGHEGPNLCAGRPTTGQTARSTAERTVRRTGFTGRINWVDGSAERNVSDMPLHTKRDDYGVKGQTGPTPVIGSEKR